jgi:hypothetical protein
MRLDYEVQVFLNDVVLVVFFSDGSDALCISLDSSDDLYAHLPDWNNVLNSIYPGIYRAVRHTQHRVCLRCAKMSEVESL